MVRCCCRSIILSIYPVFLTAVAVFRKPNAIPPCFFIDLILNFLLSWLLVLLPSTFFLDVLFFLLSCGIHSIINFGVISSGILLTWPYHCSLFLSMISMMSGFPFTPIVSFIYSFFVLSILDYLADLSTFISVDKIPFISLVEIRN